MENNSTGIAARMIRNAEPLIRSFYQHPFVQGIGSGTLDKEKFQFYMIQDYLYLFDYARVFALGVVKARDPLAMRGFADSVQATLSGEMEIHRGYMRRLGITEEEAEQARRSLDNLSYTSYMIRIAYDGTAADVTAAILSCAVSYQMIAAALVRQYPSCADHPFYGEWVRGYTGESYCDEVRGLTELMDRLAEGLPETELEHLDEIFMNCTRYEGAFWDMAWEMRL